MYEDALQGDMKLLDQLCGCGTYLEYAEAFENLVFVRLSSNCLLYTSSEQVLLELKMEETFRKAPVRLRSSC